MSKLKLVTIVGTRPEIIRLSEVLKLADLCFNHTIVHTGQNWDYTLKDVFYRDLDLREPDYYLDSAGASLGQTMGSIIADTYDLLLKLQPDALLILGDTNSTLSAISAKRLKIPIFHMEAGNRCWDWNVPEMINRKLVDHISDINLPYTENSRRYLLSEGIDGKTIFVTGSPMTEVLATQRGKIDASTVLEELNLKSGKYFVLSAHREENIDDEKNFVSLMSAVNAIAEKYQMPIVYAMHPRSRNWVKKRGFVFHPQVIAHEPFGFIDYNHLQINAYCVLSDSGTLSEESAILGFPGVLIRTSTERPEALDAGSVVIGGITEKDITQAVNLAVSLRETQESVPLPGDYSDHNVSEKVVKLIQSYAKIVNETTWRNTCK
ncbi:MAG: UDP-N-acetylglucosamine 2-epimerase (non-hydrolyzing) [Coriobacteriia bacterium]|nr:UDP-N-acetylglucosamine 2-epimerase (non-hydrolyzing) [Coriobacteriia bacterium]